MKLKEFLTNLANGFRTYLGTTDKINAQNFADKVGEVFEAGKAQGGTDWLYYATFLNRMFGGVIFPENTEIVIRVKGENLTDCGYLFNNCRNIKSVKMITETPDTIMNMDAFCSIAGNAQCTLELVDFTEFNRKFKSTMNMFQYQTILKTILGAMDFTDCTNVANMFRNCLLLEEVEFVEGTISVALSFASSANLSDTSIQSIIDGLADLTGGTAQKVEFHSTVTDKLTAEQYSQIWTKNWTTE